MTDEVTNQPPPLTGGNAWRGDPLLIQIAEEFSAPVRKDLDKIGRFVLSPEAQETARLANVEVAVLRTYDRQGRRIDIVDFHPAYHALMRRSVASGLHSSIWENGAAETGRRHQVRAARFYLTAQLETGHLCPITMTSASLAALMASPNLFREWAPRITTRKYDQTSKPPIEKTGLTLGMGMTEKQGGTDVRANTTRAERAGGEFLPPHRPQMVHVGADVGRLPRARPGERGAVLLPGAAHAGRRHRQRLSLPAAQGQARQPLQRLVGSRIRQRHRRDGRRGRARA